MRSRPQATEYVVAAAALNGSSACSLGCSFARCRCTTEPGSNYQRPPPLMRPGTAASRPCTASPRLGRGKQQQAKQVQRHLGSAKLPWRWRQLLQQMRQVLSQCTVLYRSVGLWHSFDLSGRTIACEPAKPSSAWHASAVHLVSKWPLGGKNVATVRLRSEPAQSTFWPRSILAVSLGPLGMREEGPA